MAQTFNFTDAVPASASSCKLDAVNHVLRANGFNSVAALDTGGASYAGIIEAMLDEENKRLQRRRWNFNTAVDQELTAVSSGFSAPANTLYIQASGDSRNMNITNRNGTLYDLDKQTSTFTIDTLTVTYTTLVSNFDQIPSWFCDYVSAVVAERFNEERGPSQDRPGKRAALREAMLRAKRTAEESDTEESGFNIFETLEHRRIRGNRINPYR